MGGEGQSGGLHGVKGLLPEEQDKVRLGSQDGMKKVVEI